VLNIARGNQVLSERKIKIKGREKSKVDLPEKFIADHLQQSYMLGS